MPAGPPAVPDVSWGHSAFILPQTSLWQSPRSTFLSPDHFEHPASAHPRPASMDGLRHAVHSAYVKVAEAALPPLSKSAFEEKRVSTRESACSAHSLPFAPPRPPEHALPPWTRPLQVLTPQEFVASGDYLVRACPTWSWCVARAAPSAAANHLCNPACRSSPGRSAANHAPLCATHTGRPATRPRPRPTSQRTSSSS